MNTVFTQGKDHKVAATQETITAQNSANQGKKNFNGNKELFNAATEAELLQALKRYDFGIVRPEYIVGNLKMAQRLIDKARMSDDQKAVVRNSIGFLLTALTAQELEADDITTEIYWPEDIKDALYNAEMVTDEAKEAIEYELGCLYADITDVFEGNYSNAREVIEDALNIVREFLDVADEYGVPLGEWCYNWYDEDIAKLN